MYSSFSSVVLATFFICAFCFEKGYDLGVEEGYELGKEEGYDSGYLEAYNLGYEDCLYEFSLEEPTEDVIE